jgi:metal-responsive CopG/Arc/MetJ family transcriptional regulator
MSPRTGRPKAENPLLHDLKVRVDKELLQKLDDYCKENHIKRAEALRIGINLLLNQK